MWWDQQAAFDLAFKLLASPTETENMIKTNLFTGRHPPPWTGVHYCAFFNLTEICAHLLSHGFQADAEDQRGSTPLVIAAEEGQADMVRFLLSRSDVDANAKSHYNNVTPIMRAAKNGHTEVVQLFLSCSAVDRRAVDYWGTSALAIAASYRQKETFHVLLEGYLTPDSEASQIGDPLGDCDGWSVLSFAIKGGSAAIVKTLLESRLDLDWSQPRYWSIPVPDDEVSDKEVDAILDLLIDHGVNIDSQDKEGHSCLWYACLKGQLEWVRSLLSRGADRNLKDKKNWSPVDEARKSLVGLRAEAASGLALYLASCRLDGNLEQHVNGLNP